MRGHHAKPTPLGSESPVRVHDSESAVATAGGERRVQRPGWRVALNTSVVRLARRACSRRSISSRMLSGDAVRWTPIVRRWMEESGSAFNATISSAYSGVAFRRDRAHDFVMALTDDVAGNGRELVKRQFRFGVTIPYSPANNQPVRLLVVSNFCVTGGGVAMNGMRRSSPASPGIYKRLTIRTRCGRQPVIRVLYHLSAVEMF